MIVTLVAVHPYPSSQSVPLANAFLKSFLAADPATAGCIDVRLEEFFAGLDPDASATLLLAGNPDAVGFSIYLWNRTECCAIAAVLRAARPGLTLFAGGPEPTADPGGVFREGPFDFLIIGEGEAPFRSAMGLLSEGRPLADCAGLLVRGEAGIRAPGLPVDPLDGIPSPYLDGTLPAGRHGGVLWQLSRGCDFACSFCYDQKGAKGVRRFSLERLRGELDWFARNRVTQVFVLDSTFNQDMKRAKEVLRLIARIAPHIHFHFEVRSEFLDEELARLFARLNCSLQIGLQSADPRVQKGVRRVFNAEDFSARIALLNREGVIFGFDLIYGLPDDTLAGFEKSLDFALGFSPNHLDIFPLAVLPGTELAGRADDLGIDRAAAPPYTVVSTPAFSAGDMRKAAELAAAADIFYSRGKAVAWFDTILTPLRVSPARFLEGFGRFLSGERGGATVAEQDFTDEEIWRLQRRYLQRLFAGNELRALLPVACDLVDYHYHYAAALMSPQPDLPTDRELEQADLLAERLTRSPGARLARFNYEVFDILEAGDIDLREFVACFDQAGSCAVIYPRGGDVFTESLIEPYFELIERLDGTTPAGAIAATLAIPPDEASSFLEFAAAEGVVRRHPAP
jgi:Radical SAM superfamily/B12 binding domain